MEKKYWVPALERANDVLMLICEHPSQLKLIDLSKRLEINKSSMFSLLNTMETLNWIVREKDSTYSLGSMLGFWGNSFFKQFSLIDHFKKEAAITKHIINETIQLAKLEQREVLYLAKEEMPSPVRIASEPGKKLPAHATALGKVLLASLEHKEFDQLFSEEELHPSLTQHTLRTRKELLSELAKVREQGFAIDQEEAVMGFCCVAAPIKDREGQVIAALSCSMFKHDWENKRQLATQEICQLANKLSKS